MPDDLNTRIAITLYEHDLNPTNQPGGVPQAPLWHWDQAHAEVQAVYRGRAHAIHRLLRTVLEEALK